MRANLWLYLLCALFVLDRVRSDKDANPSQHGNYTLRWHRNVIISNGLSDGERVRHLYFNGLVAKETSAIVENKAGALLWQLSDGHRLIQIIFDAFHNMQDCEYLGPSTYVNKFLREWDRETHALVNNQTGLDYEIEPIRKKKLSPKLRKQFDFKTLKEQCKQQHQEMRRLVDTQKHGNEAEQKQASSQLDSLLRKKRDITIMPGTKYCGNGHVSSGYSDMGINYGLDQCCRAHDHCPYTIRGFKTRFHLTNYRFHTISHCDCDDRVRRSIENAMRIPHTQWCGKGNRASKYEDLGGYAPVDRCCRQHDLHCPYHIPSFEQRYGLYNSRIYTMMHCACDERFRSCLKTTDTSAANLVGNLFFNIIQTKCFVLKAEKLCTKRSWWGKCEQHELRKRAYLRDPMSY